MPRRLSFRQLALEQQPLFYLLLAMIAGLAAGAKTGLPLACWLLAASAGWLIATLLLRRRSRIAPIIICAALFLLGGSLSALDLQSVSQIRLESLIEKGVLEADEPVEVWARLLVMPELAPDRIYLLLEVERVATGGSILAAAGKVQALIPLATLEDRRDFDRLHLVYGNVVRIYCHLRRGTGFRNPGAAAFDEWLDDRDLDATAIVKSPLLIEKIREGKANLILTRLYRLRSRSISTILARISPPTSGLLVAALFGNRHFIDRRLGEGFRAGGTFHLLVISGLHVGLMAALLLALTRRLMRSNIARFAIILATIWAYALMVGAQPAVTRAAWMLSGVLVARLIYRASSGPNMLAAAGLLILAARPRELFNPAFQLSFLTVAMIVLFSVPLCERLRRVGAWQPSESTPYPPRVPSWIKRFAETIYWNEAEYRREMRASPIRYRLDKSASARWMGALRLQPLCAWSLATLLATVSVQLGLLPVMIIYFHRFSPGAPLSNLVEGALIFLLMLLGVLFLLSQWLMPSVSTSLIWATEFAGRLISRAAQILGEWPVASLTIPHAGAAQILLFALFFLLLWRHISLLDRWEPLALRAERGETARPFVRLLFFIATTVLLLILPLSPDHVRGRLSLTFLDVGQGDAIAILFPQGGSMLIDSGGRPSFDGGEAMESSDGEQAQLPEANFIEDRRGIGELAVAPFLWRRGLRRLDHIVASHGHADHVEGFSTMVRDFGIGLAIQGATPDPADHFPPQVARKGIARGSWRRGDRVEIEGVTVEILAPFSDPETAKLSINDRSLVLRLGYGARRFLLTGDIERALEARLAGSGDDLRADVLKVAHHGSRTSSTAGFLARVGARYAVISVAAPSPFGHPHPEVLERLSASGAEILLTSSCGAITFSTDGEDLRLETFTKCGSDARSVDSGGRSSRGR